MKPLLYIALILGLAAATPAAPEPAVAAAVTEPAVAANPESPPSAANPESPAAPANPESPAAPANPAPPAATTTDPTAIAEAHLEAYFATKPQSFLLDPQGLLPSDTAATRRDLLLRNAEDSEIDAYIYLFDKDQVPPPAQSGAEVCLRYFATGKPAVIAYYRLGHPQAAALFASPPLAAVLPSEELDRVRLGAVALAYIVNDPVAQFEAFASHLTSRIPTLERRLHQPATVADPSRRKSNLPSKHKSQKDRLAAQLLWLEPQARPYYPAAAAAFGAIVLLIAAYAWRRHHRSFRLPDLAVEPRLEAPYAAGIGGVISFANPHLPPATQRHQLPPTTHRR